MTEARQKARLGAVEEHIASVNRHDLGAILSTFGPSAFHEDVPWGERYEGHEGVHRYYQDLFRAAPDTHFEVKRRLPGSEGIVFELLFKGTHEGMWHGFPATGNRVRLPCIVIYEFDDEDRLAGQHAYDDRALVLEQLGVMHAPQSTLGRVLVPLNHPVTAMRVVGQALRRPLAEVTRREEARR